MTEYRTTTCRETGGDGNGTGVGKDHGIGRPDIRTAEIIAIETNTGTTTDTDGEIENEMSTGVMTDMKIAAEEEINIGTVIGMKTEVMDEVKAEAEVGKDEAGMIGVCPAG